jgi:hypothetical protein
MFYIVNMNEAQKDGLMWALERSMASGDTLLLAFDDLDSSIKFKLGGAVWSPPLPTIPTE